MRAGRDYSHRCAHHGAGGDYSHRCAHSSHPVGEQGELFATCLPHTQGEQGALLATVSLSHPGYTRVVYTLFYTLRYNPGYTTLRYNPGYTTLRYTTMGIPHSEVHHHGYTTLRA